MELEIRNIPVSLDAMAAGGDCLEREIAAACGLKAGGLAQAGWKLLRKSVDARKKTNVHFVINARVDLPDVKTEADVARLAKRAKRGVTLKPYEPPKPLAIPDLAAAGANRPRPVVVGAGPAGLFAALYLARAGLRPIVVERGEPVEVRQRTVDAFASGGPLNPNSNVQFGEGGAGTFSDGKLNTGTKNPHIRHVLEEFVAAGAPPEILIDAKPHIGTDLLPEVVRNLRRAIEAAGGEFHFNTQLIDIYISDADDGIESGGEGPLPADCLGAGDATGAGPVAPGRPTAEGVAVASVTLRDLATGAERTIATDTVILAIGHSARDTFALLRERGVAMERKPFAVGVRIEHLQADIDRAQYGPAAGHPALGAADYKLAVHNADGRGVYTFCMCPGGTVVAASSEPGALCVNGMSTHARDGRNANSALLAEVRPDDLPGTDVFAGIDLQREMEHAAYNLGMSGGALCPDDPRSASDPGAPPVASAPDPNIVGARFVRARTRAGAPEAAPPEANTPAAGAPGAATTPQPYTAPAQTVGDFLQNTSGHPSKRVRPTYPRGVTWANLADCLPPTTTAALREALPALGKKLHGFADPDAVLTGVEPRSSSPVRIVRDRATLQSATARGLYPTGEGAGYAGGIMSAATDGLRVAEATCAALAASDPS